MWGSLRLAPMNCECSSRLCGARSGSPQLRSQKFEVSLPSSQQYKSHCARSILEHICRRTYTVMRDRYDRGTRKKYYCAYLQVNVYGDAQLI